MKTPTIAELHQKVDQWKIKGFLAEDEAAALFTWAREVGHLAPALEIGSYCGLSSIYLGEACRLNSTLLFALDHHRGSEEHQLGEEYHDQDLYDSARKTMDSLPTLRQTLALFQLSQVVVPIVSYSEVVVKHWAAPLSFVFIDGGHSHEAAKHDCVQWSKHVVPGGILAIHDIFERPEDGGQGPYLALQEVLRQGQFETIEKINSLAILRRCS